MAYTPHSMAHSYSGRGSSYPYSPFGAGSTYDDYSRYPYGDPDYDDGDYAGYNDLHRPMTPHTPFTPRTNSYYGGAYDDMAVNRHSQYYNDYDGAGSVYGSGPRARRASSVSFHPTASMGGAVAPYYPNPSSVSSYGGAGKFGVGGVSPRITFRTRYSSAGMSLAEAVGGERPAGGDMYKWHDLHADRKGEIYLRVAWTGYRTITYRVPVDWRDGRVRLSSLARRVARACIHYLQSNNIPYSWDRVKLYSIEEIAYGTWQPQLTVKQY